MFIRQQMHSTRMLRIHRKYNIFLIFFVCMMDDINARRILSEKVLIVKRANKENDFGPPIQITSGVLQFNKRSKDKSVDELLSHHYDASVENAWQTSGRTPHSPKVWLDTDKIIQNAGNDVVGGGTYSNGGGSVFSSDRQHTDFNPATAVAAHIDLPNGLHTNVISAHATLQLNDNIDFNNVADKKPKRFAESYGR